jgi:hypothetical protein
MHKLPPGLKIGKQSVTAWNCRAFFKLFYYIYYSGPGSFSLVAFLEKQKRKKKRETKEPKESIVFFPFWK